MGVEFSGVVEAVGSKVKDFKEGDKVFGLAYGGAYAEYITNPSRMCIHCPEELSFEQAAGIPEVWFTAIQAMYLVGSLDPSKKERILVHAGASGVGLAAIQLAKAAGCAHVFATAGSEKKLELCRKSGATRAINYREQKFNEEIKRDTDGVDLIIDFIGQSYWDMNIDIAARDCRIVLLAAMSGGVKEVDLLQLLYKRIRVQGSTLRSRDAEYQGNLRDKFVELALDHLKSGEFKAHIDKVYNWKQIEEAQRRMETNSGDGGKIICQVTD